MGVAEMSNTPYLFGRLLAALEHTGYADRRLVTQASEVPALAAPALSRATAQHEDLLLPIVAQLPPDAFSRPLSEEEQSAFWLGYYHQRADFRKGVLPVLPEKEPKLEERYELRIDADLKAWVRENGGDKLIRALLRAARERHEA